MGALSWQHREVSLKSHTMFLTSGSLQPSFSGLVLDRQEMRFVRDFVFNVFGAEISVGDVSLLCRRYLELAENGLQESGMTVEGTVSPSLFGFEIKLAPEG